MPGYNKSAYCSPLLAFTWCSRLESLIRTDDDVDDDDILLEKLAFTLTSQFRVIVGRVHDWLGNCESLTTNENQLKQVDLYRHLLTYVSLS